ncbi:MAG: C1 family peptidase [Candidatus Kariarchaeaceae archaeon]
MRKLHFILITIHFFCFNVFSQQHGLGLILNDPLLDSIPYAPILMRGDYADLPTKYSLKKYSPTPGSQGIYGTCCGWAVAYAGRTILYAMNNNIPSDKIDSIVFSPSYVYNQIREYENCLGGTSLFLGLDVIKDEGALMMKDFHYDCNLDVSKQDSIRASKYRILEYRSVADFEQKDKAKFVRKSISEGKPVIIALDTPQSLMRANKLWIPDSTDYKYWGRGHALTVLSYDDKYFGGAVEVMNSWGTKWGDGGYAWIKYDDFNYFCRLAIEIIEKPTIRRDSIDLSGSLTFIESNGVPFSIKHNGKYFETDSSYHSETLFELFISNYQPAYIYSFSSDQTAKIDKIFPEFDQSSAYLPYNNNNIAIPDEDSYNLLDDEGGNSYYCFLYSKKRLDIDLIINQINNSNGDFLESIETVLHDDLVTEDNITWIIDDAINFKAKSADKTTLLVLIEIKLK